ncbi:MAG TPA: TlpA disulfide reductase family protein [Polyangiaceae bacterium]
MKIPGRFIDYAIWAAIGVAFLVVIRRRSSGPEEGARAAAIDLPLVGQEGRFKLADHRGKPVVLEVFASWCGACQRASPVLAEVYRAHDPNEVAFVGVSLDDTMAVAAGIKQRWGIPYSVALDNGSVARDYNVSLLPTLVVIGRDGLVRHTSTGVPSKAELERWIAER